MFLPINLGATALLATTATADVHATDGQTNGHKCPKPHFPYEFAKTKER